MTSEAAETAGPGALPGALGVAEPLGPPRSRHLGLALVVISMAQLLLVLDELIVNTALPHIQRALHFSGTGLEWDRRADHGRRRDGARARRHAGDRQDAPGGRHQRGGRRVAGNSVDTDGEAATAWGL